MDASDLLSVRLTLPEPDDPQMCELLAVLATATGADGLVLDVQMDREGPSTSYRVGSPSGNGRQVDLAVPGHFSAVLQVDAPKAPAKALLDLFGYVDRDGDGWRDMPDGKPLVFRFPTTPTQYDRLFTELWKKDLDAIGVRMEVEVAKWPELRKKSKQGLLQTWQLAWGADYPDGENFYQLLYGPNCGASNDGCFQLPAFDRLYERAGAMPPGPERVAVYQEIERLIAAYAPLKAQVHRKYNYMLQPWVLGWRKHPILHEGYRYADIDPARAASAGK